MRIEVDRDACLLHGQCVIAAPELFSFGTAGDLVWIAEPGEGLRAEAEAAADACPEQAIVIT
ncbi:MAG: ferredoxin [Rhodobacteraceae bacterium CG17_big_fil_post_rev_8_21_14_2_50_63_15]|nr:ferredoxin [Roseovarius sp.]PIV79933.1 MAG: ferredoxin [Rhodobacteraceae bacterium CG17_big_fil_post_rev_8_21_14_2_50_63_15]